MVSKEYLKNISANVQLVAEKRAYTYGDGVMDSSGAFLAGSGGLIAETNVRHLLRQLAYLKKYNPALLDGAKSKSFSNALKRMRDGDVITFGDPSLRGKARRQGTDLFRKAYESGSGGYGGIDEHALLLQKLDPTWTGGGDPGLRAAVTTQMTVPDRKSDVKQLKEILEIDRKSGGRIFNQRSGVHAALSRVLTNPELLASPKKLLRAVNKEMANSAGKGTGAVTAAQLDDLLRYMQPTTREAFSNSSVPYSILRPKNYDRAATQARLRDTAKDTIGAMDMTDAATRRRFMPEWLTEATDKAMEYVLPNRSNQAPTCGGGACYTATGRGKTLLPSDLRFNKDLDVVEDYMPKRYLFDRYGEVPKGTSLADARKIKDEFDAVGALAKLKNDMRKASWRTALPGLAFGAGRMGVGAAMLGRNLFTGAAKQVPKFNLNQFVTDQLSKFK